MEGVRAAAAAGSFDEPFLGTARRAARRAATERPTPTGGYDWSPEDIDDLVFDTVSRATPARVVLAAAGAASDAQFYRWLITACRTTLNLRARSTPAGRVLRAVEAALQERPEQFAYHPATACWALAGDERSLTWAAGNADLVEAAWGVRTATVSLNTVLGRRSDVRDVAAAVLELAGPLPKSTLGEVMAERFNVAFSEYVEYLGQPHADQDDRLRELPVGGSTPELLIDDTAEWLLAQLTEEEAELFSARLAGQSMRDVAASKGLTKYRVETLTDRLEEKLRRLAELVGSDSSDVVDRAVEILRQTPPPGHSTGRDDGELDGT